MDMSSEFQLLQSRREFLQACAALAVSACHVATEARRPPPARVDAEPEWQPILRAFTEAVVAFDHPRFPRSIGVERVTASLYEHFPIERADAFDPLRVGLRVFDDTSLFAERLQPLLDDERRSGADDGELDQAVARDRLALREARVTGSFCALDLAARRRYLSLWAQSAFTQRRRFYRSGKVLTMIATYSLPEMWAHIGYEGPLLGS